MFILGLILLAIGIVYFAEKQNQKDAKLGLTFSIIGVTIMMMMCIIF